MVDSYKKIGMKNCLLKTSINTMTILKTDLSLFESGDVKPHRVYYGKDKSKAAR